MIRVIQSDSGKYIPVYIPFVYRKLDKDNNAAKIASKTAHDAQNRIRIER